MRISKYFCLLLISMMLAGTGLQSLYAQNLRGKALADSLINELPKTKGDTDQIKIIARVAKALFETDPPEAMNYADSAMHLSQKSGWEKGIGLAYLSKGRIYRTTSDYFAGLENAGKAYENFDSANWKPGMADALSEIANNYERLGNYYKAIESNLKALSIYEELGMDANIEWVYNNIGNSYYDLKDYTKAIENYSKSLVFFKKTNDKYGIASALDNMANVYEVQGDFKKVNEYNLEAIKLFEEVNNGPALGRIYINRGNFLQLQKHSDSALVFYKKAIAIAGKLDVKSTLAFGNGGIGDIYFNLAKNGAEGYTIPDSLRIERNMLLEKAYNYFSRALELSKNASELFLMMRFTGSLSETEALRGNYKAALQFYQQSILYKDSIYNDDNKTKIATLENQRLAEVKDKEIQLLNKENALQAAEAKRVKNIQYFTIAVLGIIVLAVLIISFIQYRNGRHKQKANALLQEQKEKIEATLTELKSMQAQLIQSEKMASLGELTAGIAHEIQNPLNFVNNFSEINAELIAEMKNELLAGNKQEAISIAGNIEENEQKIIHHGRRADAIVKGMLQHSRTTTGQKELIDINALADQYLLLSYQGIKVEDPSFNAVLKTDFDNSAGKINIIPQDMGRVFLNIFNNAFYALREKKKAVSEGYEPTVSISIKKADGKIEIRIKDNGTGIPQKVSDKIFQPFFTTKPTGQGTGLGLSLSYDIIKAHGGKLSVETVEREGSVFILQLPVK